MCVWLCPANRLGFFIPERPMAYTDPSLIREHVVKIRLNDHEADLIDAWVNYTGQQKAVLLREMLLEQASLDMGLNGAGAPLVNEVPQLALFRT
jgi:hypothetical protein